MRLALSCSRAAGLAAGPDTSSRGSSASSGGEATAVSFAGSGASDRVCSDASCEVPSERFAVCTPGSPTSLLPAAATAAVMLRRTIGRLVCKLRTLGWNAADSASTSRSDTPPDKTLITSKSSSFSRPISPNGIDGKCVGALAVVCGKVGRRRAMRVRRAASGGTNGRNGFAGPSSSSLGIGEPREDISHSDTAHDRAPCDVWDCFVLISSMTRQRPVSADKPEEEKGERSNTELAPPFASLCTLELCL